MATLRALTYCLVFILSASKVFAFEELVINSEEAFKPTFKNHFSFDAGVNPSVTKFRDILSANASYSRKLENIWIHFSFLYTKGIFTKITTNNPGATGLTDLQLEDTSSSMNSVGVGVSHETNYISTLLPFTNLSETIAVDLTYNVFNETVSAKTFSGPGLASKFTLNKKISDYISFGAGILYNLAVVKRAQESDSETSSSQSLTISYLTLGLNLSFYL